MHHNRLVGRASPFNLWLNYSILDCERIKARKYNRLISLTKNKCFCKYCYQLKNCKLLSFITVWRKLFIHTVSTACFMIQRSNLHLQFKLSILRVDNQVKPFSAALLLTWTLKVCVSLVICCKFIRFQVAWSAEPLHVTGLTWNASEKILG